MKNILFSIVFKKIDNKTVCGYSFIYKDKAWDYMCEYKNKEDTKEITELLELSLLGCTKRLLDLLGTSKEKVLNEI